MKMSDVIADFIGEMLSDGGGVAELQRKSLLTGFRAYRVKSIM